MGSFRRFTSKSWVLFVNSDFFMVSGFKMKFLALLLCLFIIASQGRVLREKRETEESLVDVAAEQENDTVEKKDEGLINDSLEDIKARGPVLSKVVKAFGEGEDEDEEGEGKVKQKRDADEDQEEDEDDDDDEGEVKQKRDADEEEDEDEEEEEEEMMQKRDADEDHDEDEDEDEEGEGEV